MSTIKVNNITAFSGTYVQIAKNTEVTGTLRASSNISGTADVNVHRISGSVRGMTTLGSAIFSHATSIKTSGSISSATTISGAASLSAASLTINAVERISQNGNAIFVALTADTLDVREINNTSVTTTTLEVADKLIIVASGSNASNTNQAGVQFGGTDGSNAISSILWENSNSRLSSSTAFYVGGAFAAAGNISGAADLTVNRISGSARGMTTLGSAIFSHATSIKASGSVTAAGNISGAADLTVNRISGSERGTSLLGPVVLSNTSNALVVSGNVGIGKTPVEKLHVDGLISGSSIQAKGIIAATGSLYANAGIFESGVSNAQTINTFTLPANYNSVLYGPVTIESGDSFNISAGSNVKIINISDV